MDAEHAIVAGRGSYHNEFGMVITCEHGGNRIPESYRYLFEDDQALLDSHRGFDPGALTMAKALATAFSAPLVTSTISRLLVDLNRSIGHPRLHSEAIRNIPTKMRGEIVAHYYQPYRLQTERLLKKAIKDYGQVIHLSSHSFTPELDGKVRNADIGLLYDPSRPGELELSGRWKAALKICAPDLRVRRNYPYAGKDDGLTTWFRKRLSPAAYVGIELEINQKHIIQAGQHWPALRKLIVESLCRTLGSH
ncbi:MAG: N-formylglutamate amidohydrolase [Methylococcales bacterium]|nr:N-formylglutamate amidohydrolase [Methylococcales bacterium]